MKPPVQGAFVCIGVAAFSKNSILQYMPQYSFFDRDMSWLTFNYRVLEEAAREETPLLEKIRFLSIYCSNLDEFYRVRIPALAALQKIKKPKDSHPSPKDSHLSKSSHLSPKGSHPSKDSHPSPKETALLSEIAAEVNSQLEEFG